MIEMNMDGLVAISFKEPIIAYLKKVKLNSQAKEEYVPRTAELITNDKSMSVHMIEAYDSIDDNVIIKLETPIGETVVTTPSSNIINLLGYKK